MKLFWKLYHIGLHPWQFCIFEVDILALPCWVVSVEDELTARIQLGHVVEARVGGAHIGDHHVPVTTTEAPLQ